MVLKSPIFFRGFLVVFLNTLTTASLYTQGSSLINARAAGLAGISACLIDQWSVNNNPAAMSNLDRTFISINEQRILNVKELRSSSLSISYPFQNKGVGLFIGNFGLLAYLEQSLGLSFGMRLSDRLSMGIQILYLRLQLEEPYGRSHDLGSKIGIIYKINDQLSIGTVIINPKRANKSALEEEFYPQLFQIGISYQLNKELLFYSQINKELLKEIEVAIATEYQYSNSFSLRLGYSNLNNGFAFGFGYKLGNLLMDIGNRYDYILGFQTALTLTISIDRNINGNED